MRGSVALFTFHVLLHTDSVRMMISCCLSRFFLILLCLLVSVYLYLKMLRCSIFFSFLSAFPTNPVVKNSGPSLVGEMMKLTCTAQEVFPANLFQILWMDGEREMLSGTGSFSSGTTNLTSVYSYHVDTGDQDKRITCKVLLEMHGVPAAQAVKTASTTLSVHCKLRYFFVSFKYQFALGF